MGDPRGRWEGRTLVVETTNFNGRTGSLARNGNGNPTSEALRLVERFTRRDARRWTIRSPSRIRAPGHVPGRWRSRSTRDPDYAMYEYACHEGNYAIANILRGFRAAEQAERAR